MYDIVVIGTFIEIIKCFVEYMELCGCVFSYNARILRVGLSAGILTDAFCIFVSDKIASLSNWCCFIDFSIHVSKLRFFGPTINHVKDVQTYAWVKSKVVGVTPKLLTRIKSCVANII